MNTDVLIIGGGPAGLASAIALRQRGVDCVVVEARSAGIEKACGEGLMPDAVASLASLGVKLTPEDGFAFRGIRFLNAVHRVEALFPQGCGMGVRRSLLHARLAERARELGVRTLWNSRAELTSRTSAKITAALNHAAGEGSPVGAERSPSVQTLNFRWLVGADGHASSVRSWAGLDDLSKESLRFGFRRHYGTAAWTEFVELYWGVAGQIYVTPVAPDCVCVIFMPHDRRCGMDGMLRDFPELAQRLRDAPLLSQQRGAVSATRKLQRVADRSIALIGDASGSADAMTGEGLAVSFRQAEALAEAIALGSLAGYHAAHTRIGRLPHAMGELMLSLDRWPQLELRTMHALAKTPDLFEDLLAVHMGVKSLAKFALTRGPGLAWSLLGGVGTGLRSA